MATSELEKFYDIGLNGPGMHDSFKLSMTVSKKNLVLICLVVENCVNPGKTKAGEFTSLMTKETREELLKLIPELLTKGGTGLPEFYEKLKSF